MHRLEPDISNLSDHDDIQILTQVVRKERFNLGFPCADEKEKAGASKGNWPSVLQPTRPTLGLYMQYFTRCGQEWTTCSGYSLLSTQAPHATETVLFYQSDLQHFSTFPLRGQEATPLLSTDHTGNFFPMTATIDVSHKRRSKPCTPKRTNAGVDRVSRFRINLLRSSFSTFDSYLSITQKRYLRSVDTTHNSAKIFNRIVYWPLERSGQTRDVFCAPLITLRTIGAFTLRLRCEQICAVTLRKLLFAE